MRRQLVLFFYGLCFSVLSFALSGQAYMDRFNAFTEWNQHLPINPTAFFLDFIKESSPLSTKLREKWLYELARIKDWTSFNSYYQDSKDINLVCYKQIAAWNQNQQKEALQHSLSLWLTGDSLPKPCNSLFELLLASDDFKQSWITQRIALALDKLNLSLALALLKQYKIPHVKQIQLLTLIGQNPSNINRLSPGELQDTFYLYGLKRLVSMNMDKALQLWQQTKTKKILSKSQQQDFLARVALYKAMRNNTDTLAWFSKIKPEYYNDLLLDWQIRFALKNQDWKHVSEYINSSINKDSPCWQYWLARSLEEQDQKAQAVAIYENLSKKRQYYGFLSSIRLHQKPNFENEKPNMDLKLLRPYQTVMEQVKFLYSTKQNVQASRLLNDFISELPKEEASALVYWIDSVLQWYGKSVYLSNNEMLNNQLLLRFPLAYKNTIGSYAKKYTMAPELVYAIIRQESGFREDVISSAGARGLMQVMPYTASIVSKMSKIVYQDPKQLFFSDKNIHIGVAYLQQLAKRFGNHPVLIAAAYNAGPRQVVYWLNNHRLKEMDLWIETLPWQETRNYLKNVMAFYMVYQYRFNKKPDLTDFLTPLV